MKRIKIFFTLLIVSLILVACGPGKQLTSNDNIYGATRMYYTINTIFGTSQVDSLINADQLAPLNAWIQSYTIADEGKIRQYLYIKSLEKNSESIYTVTETSCDTLFKCTKRITEEIK